MAKINRESKLKDMWFGYEGKYTCVPNAFLEHAIGWGLKPIHILIVVQLLKHKWDKHHPFPSLATLRKSTGTSGMRSSVQRAIVDLEKKYELLKRVVRRNADGDQTSNAYDLSPLFVKLAALEKKPATTPDEPTAHCEPDTSIFGAPNETVPEDEAATDGDETATPFEFVPLKEGLNENGVLVIEGKPVTVQEVLAALMDHVSRENKFAGPPKFTDAELLEAVREKHAQQPDLSRAHIISGAAWKLFEQYDSFYEQARSSG
jgi:hypothetical protein